MLGYNYFYENDSLNQSEKFMIFSLDPVSEDSKLNLAHTYSLPILIEPGKFKLNDEFSYQFCDQISQLVKLVLPNSTLVKSDPNI